MLRKIPDIIGKYTKTTAFLCGSLGVLALPPYYQWWWLFIVFSIILEQLKTAVSAKKALSIGYCFGFGFFAFGFNWVNNALLVAPEKTGWLVPIAFLASGAFFGLFTAFPAYLAYKFKKNFISLYLTFPAFMVLFEWLRSWILTGFPWNLWGYALAFNLPMIQTAAIWGTYGLSFLVILITSAPTLFLNYKTKKSSVITAIIIFICPLLLWSYGTLRIKNLQNSEPSDTTIRLVQPSIPQSLKWSKELAEDHFSKYIELSGTPSAHKINMTIWGETASPFPLDLDETARMLSVQNIMPDSYLTTGLVRYERDYYDGYQLLNSALIINKQGLIEDFYDKTHLVPFGEYIPLRRFLPQWIKPVTGTISDFKAGSGAKIINLPNIPPFGILICYEIIFPHQIINPNHRPEWLINLTNDGWYGISSGPYQHFVSTQLRAVEEGITIVRSANSGISGIINRYGKILATLPLNHVGVLDYSLPKKLSITTFYGQNGNYLIVILCFLNILIAAWRNRLFK